MKEERCTERGAIGPYPYAVGMLQVRRTNESTLPLFPHSPQPPPALALPYPTPLAL